MGNPIPDGPWVVAPWHSGTVMPQRWIDGDRDGTPPEDRGPFATIHTTSPELALRVVDALNAAGVAAGPQATPQVLWEGETSVPAFFPEIDEIENSEVRTDALPVPPGTRVRVVAAPTGQEDHDG